MPLVLPPARQMDADQNALPGVGELLREISERLPFLMPEEGAAYKLIAPEVVVRIRHDASLMKLGLRVERLCELDVEVVRRM